MSFRDPTARVFLAQKGKRSFAQAERKLIDRTPEDNVIAVVKP